MLPRTAAARVAGAILRAWPAHTREVSRERWWLGGRPRHLAERGGVFRQLHHVVEVTGFVVLADVEEANLRRVRGNGLELADAVELPQIRTLTLEAVTINHLERTTGSRRIARQPHVAVTAMSDQPFQRIVRHHWRGTRGPRTVGGSGTHRDGWEAHRLILCAVSRISLRRAE